MPVRDSNKMSLGPVGSGPEEEETTSNLTTLDDVRAFMQKSEEDTAQDAVIEAMIAAASAEISHYCQRQFFPEKEVAKVFEWEHTSQPKFIDLAPYEVQSVTSVEVDTDTDSPTELTKAEFKLWPSPNPDGTYLGIKLNPYSIGSIPVRWWPEREVTIKGDWGMPAIPANVSYWALMTVVIWMRRDVSAFETGMHVDEGYVERPKSLPSAAMAGLDLYRRLL